MCPVCSLVLLKIGLGSRASAATKPQIKTHFYDLTFSEKRDCHIWVRFRLTADFEN